MDKKLLFVMGVAVFLILPIVFYLLEILDRKQRTERNYGASLAERPRKNIHRKLYHMLMQSAVTAGYTRRIRRFYELLYPGEEDDIRRKTVGTVAVTWLVCAIIILLIFVAKPNFNNAAVALLLVYVMNTEIVVFMTVNLELKILEELCVFFSNVRHNFYLNQMVDDAILLALQDTKSLEMKLHAKKIYEVIISSSLKEDAAAYNASMHNRYMKMFLSLCMNVVEYSDKEVKGQNLFTANLDNLKKEINNEIIKIKKIRYKFSGFTFVAIAVCVPIDAIKNYGLSMLPEMDSFYNGSSGIIYVLITLLTALFIYILNNKLKEMKMPIPQEHSVLKHFEKVGLIRKALDNYTEKNYSRMAKLQVVLKRLGETITSRQLLLKRMLFSAITGLCMILFFIYLHEINQYNLIHKVAQLPQEIVTVNESQREIVKETILETISSYLKIKPLEKSEILMALVKQGTFHQEKVNDAIVDEVLTRINKYQMEYFQWYELIICIGISIIAFYLPYWLILYKKSIQQMNMEDEVNQLNAIIYMLMYCDHITVKQLLEEMELFAVAFKQPLQECINDYNSGDVEALERMRDGEAFEPFKRLVNNLIRCDDVAIYKAFDEIAAER
ncbi:MAG: hypothetical protein K0S04_2922 [Herbinix sp.]|nr:hypothetical protein [Herbinix sp.]